MSDNNVTGSSSVRDRQRQAKREEILNAAREVFVELGAERTTLREVARRANRTTGAIFAHFKDKEALLRELCVHDFLTLRQAFQSPEQEPDPIERLRNLGRSYAEFALSHPNHYRLMFLTPHTPDVDPDNPDLRQGNPDQDAYALLRYIVGQVIEAGFFRDDLDDPELVAQVMWGALHGNLAFHLTHAKDPWVDWRPIVTRCALVVDGLIQGFLKEPGPLRAFQSPSQGES